MNTIHPWQLLLATLAGWINREQQGVIDYLVEENRVLKRQLGRRRLRLTDEERCRLAVKGKALGRRVFGGPESIVVSTISLPFAFSDGTNTINGSIARTDFISPSRNAALSTTA